MNKLCRDANAYLAERTGTYEFRCRRYKAVADIMCCNYRLFWDSRFNQNVVDIGAGACEFGKYLRKRLRHWQGLYLPFDAAIDGIDLAKTMPILPNAEFYVAIEFLEHLDFDGVEWYLRSLPIHGNVVLTTPNPETTDVLGMDRTHKTPISTALLKSHGYIVRAKKLFTSKQDTLVAYKARER